MSEVSKPLDPNAKSWADEVEEADQKEAADAEAVDQVAAVAEHFATSKLDELQSQFKIDTFVPSGKPAYDSVKAWKDLVGAGLDQETVESVLAANYVNPTPIQRSALPIVLNGHSLVAQSQTGTGKTATFAMAIIEKMDTSLNHPQAVVMCPTHEIAVQAKNEIEKLGKHKGVTAIASSPQTDGQTIVNVKPITQHVVCSAPGTLNTWIRRSTKRDARTRKQIESPARFDAKKLKVFVIDEADQILTDDRNKDMVAKWGQKGTIVNKSLQWILLSATYPEDTSVHGFMHFARNQVIQSDPYTIFLRPDATLQNIYQYQMDCGYEANRYAILEKLFKYAAKKMDKTFIFCNYKSVVDDLSRRLIEDGHHVASIHGDKKEERAEVVERFRKGEVNVVVCTNLLHRGVDIPNAKTVINFDLPVVHGEQDVRKAADTETYTHRIGRAGRVGQPGLAISFVFDDRTKTQIKVIAKKCGRKNDDGVREINPISDDETKFDEEIYVP